MSQGLPDTLDVNALKTRVQDHVVGTFGALIPEEQFKSMVDAAMSWIPPSDRIGRLAATSPITFSAGKPGTDRITSHKLPGKPGSRVSLHKSHPTDYGIQPAVYTAGCESHEQSLEQKGGVIRVA